MVLRTEKIQSETINLARKLIGIPSFTGSEKEISEFIASYFDKIKIPVAVDNYNVVATLGPPERDAILLNGHMDTVPISEKKWDVDPFSGEIIDGHMIGLGAVDMKASLASMMIALKYLHKHSKKWQHELDHKIIFTAVVCEEATKKEEREKGIISLIRKGFCKNVKYAIVGEATNLNAGIGHKGRVIIRVTGKPCHSSMPHLGANAVRHLCGLIDALYDRKLPWMSKSEKDRPETTLEVVRIAGGTADNVIPGSSSAILESRYFTEEALVNVKRFLDDTVQQYTRQRAIGNIHLSVEVVEESRIPVYLHTPKELLLIDCAQKIISKIYKQCTYYLNNFYTDAGYLHNLLNIPAMIFGPGDERYAHRVNEKIPISHLDLAPKVFYELCKEFPIMIKEYQLRLATFAASQISAQNGILREGTQ